MSNPSGKPKPAFFIAVLVVIAGLIGFAFMRCSKKRGDDKTGAGTGTQKIDLDDIKKGAGGAPSGVLEDPNALDGVTTVKDYTFAPSEKLPPVPGTSDYKGLGKDRVVKFAINVWAGWAPIIHANEGFKPKKEWKDASGKPFKVELVLIDNPIQMRNTFAAGEVHVGWATVDMLPLLVEGLKKDPRTMPRVYQQVDWSNGGDGIVVRDTIKTVSDLRGKKVVLAENSPSHYFLLNALLNGGVQPEEVNMVFTQDAFQAARAFATQKDIAAAVSWAPDIYRIAEKIPGNKLLVTTLQANHLIADVWFARADFARDNPDIIEGLVRGILDSTTALKDEPAKKQAADWMADGYGIPADETFGMLGDAHWTNYAENREFFMNANNPTNFERTYNTAFLLYKAVGSVSQKVDFDQLMDFSVIKKLGDEDKYKKQKNEYEVSFAPVAPEGIQVESSILTKTVVVQFFPNSSDLYKKVEKKMSDGSTKELLYDPNVDYTVEEIAKLSKQYGAARILIEGHTDGSMKGTADEKLVEQLSFDRANAVKQALINKFQLPPNQFTVSGVGWKRPADAADPNNHAKNRRVEVKVIPAEAQ
ncbi:MAG TPA: phosphate ABC transporter substrate-binding/OmpA family protein [Kofleriaceae bacterium]|jgi:ABC-type nitrate/sulfonate/bicarbonate transport system substrate-binding protein|nr:phosphate ABC transporter substrate-binding/OmpA family protein [Kofleriaceae bacterium]